jgi:hypothetical protein
MLSNRVASLLVVGSIWIGLAIPAMANGLTPASPEIGFMMRRVDSMIAQPNWEYEILNPTVATSDDMRATSSQYIVMLAAAESLLSSSGLDLEHVGSLDAASPYQKSLIKLWLHLRFLIGFFDEPEEVSIIPLSGLDDPALRCLREELSLKAPPGSAYVRTVGRMSGLTPAPLQEVIDRAGPSAAAITCRIRFIIVIDETRDFLQQLLAENSGKEPVNVKKDNEIKASHLQRTRSHELVHAFINATVGYPDDKIPLWLDESLAIYCSQSHLGTIRVIRTRDGYEIEETAPTGKYQDYERVFNFLRKSVGSNRFHGLLARCVTEQTPNPLLQAAGYTSYEAVVDKLTRDSNRTGRIIALIFLAILIVVFVQGFRHMSG